MSRPLFGLVEDHREDVMTFCRGFGPVADLLVWDSGEAFIAALLEEQDLLERLDLLFIDLGLPGIDGVHLAHTIRGSECSNDLPVIVLSGSQAEPDIVRALDAGVTEYEIKPTTLADLRALVQRNVQLARPAAAQRDRRDLTPGAADTFNASP